MHTSTFNNTTFSYNSDYSGPIKIAVGDTVIETDIDSLKQFVEGSENIDLQKINMSMQKMIIKTKYDEFSDVVNNHLSNGWKVVVGTFQISGVGESEDDYEFRYGVVLQKDEG